MKKIVIIMMIIMVITAGQVFAGGAAETGPLKVGVMPSAVGAPVQYALENGYFADEGIEIDLILFPSGAPINEAVAAKQLDVACSGAATIFSLASGTNKLIADVESSGGMGIWVRPDSPIMTVQGQVPENPAMYGSTETVRGKKFIANLGTASQYNVLRYAERFGLKDTDIEIIHMDWGAGAQAFISGEADAIATFSPYSFQVMEKGAVLATTFEDATQTALYDMVFTRNEVIKERRDDLVKFMRAFQRAIEDLADDDIRREFSMRWFADNGRTYSDEVMDQELIDRRYVTKELMSSDSYVFGEAMPQYARFNESIGKIEKDNLKYVDDCFDETIIEDAIGIDLTTPRDL
jgi:ABC-type nitrate/sulfonate/bicarbonate transport system substrate-binding protein